MIGAAWGAASAAAAVALLATSGWLIVSASFVTTLVALNVAIVAVRFFATSRAVFRYLERLTGHDAALRQLAATRGDMVERLVPLSPGGLNHTDRGAVLSSLVDDVDELQNLPLRVVQPVVIGVLVALGGIIVTAFVAPFAALTLASCVVVSAVVAWFVGWLGGARAERAIAATKANLSSALTDYFGSFDELVAFGAEPAARARVLAADAALRAHMARTAGAQAATNAVISGMSGIASIAAIAVTAPSVTNPAAGAWLAVAALLPMVVFEVFGAVPLAASSWRRVHSAAERIANVLPDRIPAEFATDAPDARDVDVVLGSGISLANITAGHPGSPNVLRGLNLDVAAGERVLITGSSGAGKSTLANVLVRFLSYRGTYSIGTTDVQAVTGAAVRRTVGLCEQSPMIFDEDIRQNLLFARDTATDADLVAVLERVGLGAWLAERGGLDARVGEAGSLLSGGQAQRLALARAMLHDVDVLVLDEPTANVDPAQSDALLRDLLSAGAGRTVVLISHASVPADLIDRELHLADGELAQR